MSEKRISSVWVAILGIVIGALAVLTVDKATESNRRLRAEYSDWRKLNLILQKVDEMYVDTVDHESVTDAAVVAALSKLDPHSVYMPPVELEESEADLNGFFDGIGIQFNVPNDTAIVLEVIPGGPSEKIGMLPGDRLLSVDDKVIAGVKFPQDSMVRRIKGPAGSKVLVKVLRDGVEIPFEITRGKIPVHSIDAYFMVNDTTGYIRLSKFARTTYTEFISASIQLLAHDMKHLIVDLRDNTGGYFDQSLLLANMFLEKGDLITYMEGLHCRREEFKADGKGILKNVGLTVLINESSASSSEIFSGAIQDNDRGVIVGRRSFGKGLVQEPVNFTDGSGIRITVARYYTPSGRCIQKPYTDDYHYDIIRRYNDGELTDADSIKVDIDASNYTVKTTGLEDGCTFEVAFAQTYLNTITEETTLTVTYTAVLNENASYTTGKLNKTQLTWGDQSKTEWDSTTTNTHKFEVLKYAAEDDTKANLPGAIFELHKGTGDDAVTIKLIKVSEILYRVANGDETGAVTSFTTVATGNIVIDGVDSDTDYTLVETKAPEGFFLDENVYAFSITENGKTVIVENEAGKGFINKAQVGNIRIEKTSEDGVLKGFTFRVEGSDITGNAFSKDFVTDENGQIHIEGLRVGNYVISEVGNKANEKYVLPENVTVTVHEGKTVVAKFHNALKPVTPDIPKTGDTTNMPLWAALAGISLLGAGAAAFFTFRKKKEVGKHER